MKVYRLDLNDVVQHPGRRVEYPIELWLEREEAPPLAQPIWGTLVAESGGRILRLHGEFRTTVWLECGRCLSYFQLPVALEIHEEFPLVGTPAGLSAYGYAEVEDRDSFPVFEGNYLYVDDLLRQYLLLELPIAPVCREDCKGLCPTCGQNLNEAPCACAPRKGHPAFEAWARAWYSDDS
ncbi:MAG: YceD family protein [Fimbriimonadales bacterium]